MFRYLPSKKVFFVAVFAVVVLVFSFFYEESSTRKFSSETDPILALVNLSNQPFSDADGDGLYDWEEVIYLTDANNPDSDGDGVNDGEQYKVEQINPNVGTSDSVYTAINRLGEEAQNFTDPLKTLSTKPIVYDDPFTINDLSIADIGDKEAEDFYLAKMLILLSNNTESLEKEPLDIINSWLETKSQEDLAKLRKITEENIKIANLIIDIDVPIEYVDLHLKIANNLYKTALSLENIEITNIDPTQGFLSAANYANYQTKYIEAALSLIGHITNNNG